MADDLDQVGNLQGQGDSESSGQAGQQSPDIAALESRIKNLEAQYKGVQKGTDKVNSRVEKEVTDLKSQVGRIADLLGAGMTPAQVETQLVLDEIIAERKGRSSESRGQASPGAGSGSDQFLQDLVNEFQLDANDKAVADAISKGDTKALVRLGIAKSGTPEPDASTAPPLQSREKGATPAQEIERGYLEEIGKVRGNPHKASLVKEKWRKKAREAGLMLNV